MLYSANPFGPAPALIVAIYLGVVASAAYIAFFDLGLSFFKVCRF